MPNVPLLRVNNLEVTFATPHGEVTPLVGACLEIGAGETVALVGESGSGKTVLGLSIVGLLGASGRISAGEVWLRDGDGSEPRNLAGYSTDEMLGIRGNEIGMIFQEPMTSLNPVFSVGEQVAEGVRIHRRVSRREALEVAAAMLADVGLPDVRRVLGRYPHQLSGGQRQRVMIAMALACRPSLLIADEPTTALDATVQAQILDLLRRLQGEKGMSIIFITHNLGVVAEIASRLYVLYAGRVLEEGTTMEVFARPRHPYTLGLMACLPRLGRQTGERRLKAIPGSVPTPGDHPPGCVFSPRCELADDECRRREPALAEVAGTHRSRCRKWGEL